ncbi:DUF1566 domain-containing protein [uncultured Thiocystis sp.]|jgi:hypothetical protein|uniref:Lcl C-terminal domain-containing protein n=1 Tax=uncultured Thiocystis sp. TaxID=1202134 RepID=UPI0025EC6F8D|nr:DUF1566 domain-containing protein [uncultured Thiocystis sp.]
MLYEKLFLDNRLYVRFGRFRPLCFDQARRGALTILLLTPLQTTLAADIPSATDTCVGGKAETAPSTEFVAIEDGSAVRHERTTLEWQRCARGQTWNGKSNLCDGQPTAYTWEKATRLATALEGGWRLPTGEELLSIVERCHISPAINPQVFPNTPASLFWSSSSDTGGLNRAWSVSFFTGSPYRPGKIQSGRIRLVRGTMRKTPPATP